MFVTFLLRTAPASKKAKPHCITEKDRNVDLLITNIKWNIIYHIHIEMLDLY